jgi:beta-glucosidase
MEVTIDVKNSSQVDGSVAVDLFVKDKVASITPAIRKHIDFKKIYLKAGEKQNLRFSIRPDQLMFVTSDLQRVVEDGEFEVIIEGKKKRFFYVTN